MIEISVVHERVLCRGQNKTCTRRRTFGLTCDDAVRGERGEPAS